MNSNDENQKTMNPSVSMRLRPEEIDMMTRLEDRYQIYGVTNVVRASSRILDVLQLTEQQVLFYLLEYERNNEGCEPIKFKVQT